MKSFMADISHHAFFAVLKIKVTSIKDIVEVGLGTLLGGL